MRWGFLVLLLVGFALGGYFWNMRKPITLPDPKVSLNHLPLPTGMMVRVGSHTITREDLDWEANFHLSGIADNEALTPIPEISDGYRGVKSTLKDRLISSVIERKLVMEYLKSLPDINLDRPELYEDCLKEFHATMRDIHDHEVIQSPKDRERLKERICEWDVISQILEDQVLHKAQISPEQIAQYYKDHGKEFKREEQVVLRQIVTSSEKQAIKLRNRLPRSSFEHLAREHSITPEAENGGLLPAFSRDEFPRFFNVAFSMRIGEVRGVLKSTYGFHIIRLEKKIPARKLSLEEATPLIRRKLQNQIKEKGYQQWLEAALNTIPIESPKTMF